MRKKTDELFKILEQKDSFDDYVSENNEEFADKSLHEMLDELLKNSGMTKSEILERANIDRVYGYQIFSGEKKNPSRDKILMLCIAMKCNVSQVQNLLKRCSYSPLYPRIKRDSALIFSIEQKLDLMETNDLLYKLDMDILE